MKIKNFNDYNHSYSYFENRVPKAYTWFLRFIILILFISLLWAYLGKIDIVVKAQANLRHEENTSIIKNAMTGVLVERRFISGGRVKKGDVLWKVDTTSLQVDINNTVKQYERVSNKIDLLSKYLKAISLTSMDLILTEMETSSRASVFYYEVKLLEQVYKKKNEELNIIRALPESMVQPREIRELLEEENMARIKLLNYKAKERLQVQNELDAFILSKENLEKHIANLQLQIDSASVRAPINGVVEVLKKINNGDYLFSGEEIIRVVPESSGKLKAELIVDNGDFVGLEEGMKVSLRFPALPPSEFGELEGRVTVVPADAALSMESLTSYILEAELNSSFLVSNNGNRVELKPGMLAEGRILLERKSILKFILEKLDFIS